MTLNRGRTCEQHYGYPQEWFPSVSATIGDWFPERNVFQILIALTSGPRLVLVLLAYLVARTPNSSLPGFIGCVGFVRTLAAGGWMFVTSSDKSEVHDFTMILYIVSNIPWMAGTVYLSPIQTRRKKRTVALLFFATLVPLVYLYIQHKVHRVAGGASFCSLPCLALLTTEQKKHTRGMLTLSGRSSCSTSSLTRSRSTTLPASRSESSPRIPLLTLHCALPVITTKANDSIDLARALLRPPNFQISCRSRSR